MFFDEDESDLPTSEGRYWERIRKWKKFSTNEPELVHRYHWLVHNCIVHPMLAFYPNKAMARIHDRTSADLSLGSFNGIGSLIPEIKNKGWWIIHNLVAHMAIGLLPCSPTFSFHDWTAKKMDVEGWV